MIAPPITPHIAPIIGPSWSSSFPISTNAVSTRIGATTDAIPHSTIVANSVAATSAFAPHRLAIGTATSSALATHTAASNAVPTNGPSYEPNTVTPIAPGPAPA